MQTPINPETLDYPGITPQIREAIRVHVCAEFPREACGYVHRTHGYIPCENVAEDPTKDWRFNAETQELCAMDDDVLYIIHSHPYEISGPMVWDRNEGPSYTDMRQQIATGKPWGLAIVVNGHMQSLWFWGNDNVEVPYEGRPFVSGIFDCYALARDWMRREKGIELPVFPRGNLSWESGKELFTRDIWEKAGFEVVSPHELQTGDAFLAAIHTNRSQATYPNHCGVYVGRGLVLHHLYNRLSCTVPGNVWFRYMTIGLRHVAGK